MQTLWHYIGLRKVVFNCLCYVNTIFIQGLQLIKFNLKSTLSMQTDNQGIKQNDGVYKALYSYIFS